MFTLPELLTEDVQQFDEILSELLFQTSPRDPVVLGGASAVLLVAAVVASLGPALRATKVDPTTALRAE